MRTIILVTGFNNWGKTTIINNLFGKKRFMKHKLHNYSGTNFCVIPQSNDDLGKQGYEDEYHNKIKILSNHGIKPKYIISAFCPTKEPVNDSEQIISNLYSKDKVYILALINKWCGHAKLIEKNIKNHYKNLNNVTVVAINKSGNSQFKEFQLEINKII